MQSTKPLIGKLLSESLNYPWKSDTLNTTFNVLAYDEVLEEKGTHWLLAQWLYWLCYVLRNADF